SELPLTLVAQALVHHESGQDVQGYRDYRGVPVIGVWLWDNQLGFGLATEVDKAEAYTSYWMIRRLTYALFAILALGGAAIIWLMLLREKFARAGYALEQANAARK